MLTLEEDPASQKGWLTVFRLQSYKADRDDSCESRLNAMFVRPDQKKVVVGRFNSISLSIGSYIVFLQKLNIAQILNKQAQSFATAMNDPLNVRNFRRSTLELLKLYSNK